jgi:hypothetical protein
LFWETDLFAESNLTIESRHLITVLESQLEAISLWKPGDSFDIFIIIGNSATSKYYDLLSDFFVGAYQFSYDELQHSQQAANMIHDINWTRNYLDRASFAHNRMISDPKCPSMSSCLHEFTDQLTSLAKNYAAHELQECQEIVHHTLSNRW